MWNVRGRLCRSGDWTAIPLTRHERGSLSARPPRRHGQRALRRARPASRRIEWNWTSRNWCLLDGSCNCRCSVTSPAPSCRAKRKWQPPAPATCRFPAGATISTSAATGTVAWRGLRFAAPPSTCAGRMRSQNLYRQEVNFLGALVGQELNDDGALSFRLYGPWQRLKSSG